MYLHGGLHLVDRELAKLMHQGSIHACEMAACTQLDGICRGSLMNLPPQFAPEPLLFASAKQCEAVRSPCGVLGLGVDVRLAILWDMDAKGGPEASEGLGGAFGRRASRCQEIRNPQDFVHSAAGHRARFLTQHGVPIVHEAQTLLRLPPGAVAAGASRNLTAPICTNPSSSIAARACRWPLGQCSLPRRRACPHTAQCRVPDRGRD